MSSKKYSPDEIKKKIKKKLQLESWVIAIICIVILICFIIVGYLFFLFNNGQKMPQKLMSNETAWKKLGLGPALGLV